MDGSLSAGISLIGSVVFAVLWCMTPGDIRCETVETEIVSLKKVFPYIAAVCFGFWLNAASSLWQNPR